MCENRHDRGHSICRKNNNNQAAALKIEFKLKCFTRQFDFQFVFRRTRDRRRQIVQRVRRCVCVARTTRSGLLLLVTCGEVTRSRAEAAANEQRRRRLSSVAVRTGVKKKG